MLQNFGKWFILAGICLIVIGLAIWLGSKWGIPFGKLPGDIQMHKEKVSFYFPIATSIILNIVLTILLNLIFWLFKK